MVSEATVGGSMVCEAAVGGSSGVLIVKGGVVQSDRPLEISFSIWSFSFLSH